MQDYLTKKSIDSIDKFKPNKEQLNAIYRRDYITAVQLGVTFDQYMAVISPTYRTKLAL